MLGSMPLAELLQRVAGCFGLEVGQLRQRSRNPEQMKARDIFCVLAVRMLGYSGAEAGRLLALKRAAVSHAVRRGETHLALEPGLTERILGSS